MRGTAPGLAAGVVALSALAAACSPGITDHTEPTCRNTRTLVLQAQAVPTAQQLPCVTLLPVGWTVFEMDIESGRAEFTLSNDRAGHRAVRVRLTSECDTSGATEIPSDEPGTRRFERIESVRPGFAATRLYTFSGGCVTYRFELKEAGRALVNEASLAVTFVSREQVAVEARRLGDGKVGL
jgi:hypothetical protein